MGDLEEIASLCQTSVIGDGIYISGQLDHYKKVIQAWQKKGHYKCPIHQISLDPQETPAGEPGGNYFLWCDTCGITWMVHVGDPRNLKLPENFS